MASYVAPLPDHESIHERQGEPMSSWDLWWWVILPYLALV